MALNEDWENLAENYDVFERKAMWAQASNQVGVGSAATLLAVIITAVLPLCLFLMAADAFREDNWAKAFGLLALLTLSVVCFKWILRIVSSCLAVVLVVGLLWWVGSCMYNSVSDKVVREEAKAAEPAAPPVVEEAETTHTYDEEVELQYPGYKRIPCEGTFPGEKAFCLVKKEDNAVR